MCSRDTNGAASARISFAKHCAAAFVPATTSSCWLARRQYYARFGFERARLYGLDNEYGVDEEFMVLELRKGSLERASGLVRYVPEFGELSS